MNICKHCNKDRPNSREHEILYACCAESLKEQLSSLPDKEVVNTICEWMNLHSAGYLLMYQASMNSQAYTKFNLGKEELQTVIKIIEEEIIPKAP